MAEVRLGVPVGATRRLVVIKTLRPELADEPSYVAMFMDEVDALSALSHPCLLGIQDAGFREGCPYLVTEYLDGLTFDLLRRTCQEQARELPRPIALHVLGAVAEGLVAAHGATTIEGAPLDLVHRDVSPSNVIVLRSGHAKLIDFGVVKTLRNRNVTRVGTVKGKPRYIAPELIEGRAPTPAADVWGLGVLLWETLTGRPLFHGRDHLAIITSVVERPISPPSAHADAVDTPLEDAVMGALQRDPRQRWSMEALHGAIRSWRARHAPEVGPRDVAAFLQETAGAHLEERDRRVRRWLFEAERASRTTSGDDPWSAPTRIAGPVRDDSAVTLPPRLGSAPAALAIDAASDHASPPSAAAPPIDSASTRAQPPSDRSPAAECPEEVEPEPQTAPRAPNGGELAPYGLLARCLKPIRAWGALARQYVRRVFGKLDIEAPVLTAGSAPPWAAMLWSAAMILAWVLATRGAEGPTTTEPPRDAVSTLAPAGTPPAFEVRVGPSIIATQEEDTGREAVPRRRSAEPRTEEAPGTETSPSSGSPTSDADGEAATAAPADRGRRASPSPGEGSDAQAEEDPDAASHARTGEPEPAPEAVAERRRARRRATRARRAAARARRATRRSHERRAARELSAPEPADARTADGARVEGREGSVEPSDAEAPAAVVDAREPEGNRVRDGDPVDTPASDAPTAPAAPSSLDEARRSFRAGRYREAARHYAAVVRDTPHDPLAFAGLAAARLRVGDTVGAREAYRRAARLAPNNASYRAAVERLGGSEGDVVASSEPREPEP